MHPQCGFEKFMGLHFSWFDCTNAGVGYISSGRAVNKVAQTEDHRNKSRYDCNTYPETLSSAQACKANKSCSGTVLLRAHLPHAQLGKILRSHSTRLRGARPPPCTNTHASLAPQGSSRNPKAAVASLTTWKQCDSASVGDFRDPKNVKGAHVT